MALGSDVIVRFLGDTRQLTAATAKAGDDLTKFGTIGKVASGAIVGIGVAAAGAAVASIMMATKFQQSMELLHTQAGVAQGQVGALSKAVLDLAPKVGTGPDALAESLFHIESTINKALPPAEQMKIAMDRLKIAAEGAKVGNSDLTDTTNALNAVVASGIKGSTNLAGAMGSLNAIVGAGDMHMQDLAEAMGSGVLAVIKGYGVSLTEAGAALATFGDNNIRGADAATMLRMAVQSLTVGTPKAAKELKTIGLASDALAKEMQTHGLTGAMDLLVAKMNKAGVTGPKVGQFLTEAFGKKAGPGLAVLVSQFSRFQSKLEEVNKGAGTFGGDWAQTTKTAAFQFSQLKETVSQLAIKLGTALLPVAEKLTQWALTAINWMEKHATLTRNVAIAFGVLAASIYLVLNPWVLLVAAVVAIGVALTAAYEKVGWFHTAVDAVGRALKALGGFIWDAVKAFVGLQVKVIEIYKGAITWLYDAGKNILKGLLNGLKAMASAPLDFIKGQAKAMIGAAKSIFGIKSPSTVFAEIGTMINEGLAFGIKSSASKVVNAQAKTLQALQKSAQSMAAQVAQSFSQGATLSSAFSEQQSSGQSFNYVLGKGLVADSGGSSLAARFAMQVQNMKDFAKKLTSLRKMGLNNTTMQEIVGAGVAQGGAMADALLGDKASVASINSSEAALQAAAGQVGAAAAESQYGPQVVAALNKLVKLMEDAPAKTARSLTGVSGAAYLRAHTVTGR